jgi:hypothetical protein
MAQPNVYRCEPLPPDLQARLITITRGTSVRRLHELFRGVPPDSVARAAAGMAVNPTTRVAIEAELVRLVGAP